MFLSGHVDQGRKTEPPQVGEDAGVAEGWAVEQGQDAAEDGGQGDV